MSRNPLDEILSAIGGATEAVRQQFPPEMEQVASLRSIFQGYNKKHTFAPGQFVRYKTGLGVLKVEVRDSIVLMFWRMLDLDDFRDRLRVKDARKDRGTDRPDCLLVYWHPAIKGLIHMVADSGDMEPWLPPDTH